MALVDVSRLRKAYGNTVAVEDLSFSVESGEILGLIGPNGAGKSTTIKIILGFMEPDAGTTHVFGHAMTEPDKNRIGYLPEEKGLYKNLTVIDLIVYLAALKGVDRTTSKQRADELLRQTGLFESRKKKIKELSKGMGQMIQLIVTILHDPELLILDEPFSGLDPVNTELMRTMIKGLRDAGKAIILSTHQMNQVEELCDRVLMIDHGRSVLYGRLAEARAQYRKHSVQVSADGDLSSLDGVVARHVTTNGVELVLAEEASTQHVLDQLRGRGVVIDRFEVTTPTLHEIFLKIAGQAHD